jgi:hypothetical protein
MSPADPRLIWVIGGIGAIGLLFLILFALWMFKRQEPLTQSRLQSWTLYGQFLLSTLLVILVCLLMIPRTISPEAGLAVLSAIAGFAAGRTSGSGGRGPDGGKSDPSGTPGRGREARPIEPAGPAPAPKTPPVAETEVASAPRSGVTGEQVSVEEIPRATDIVLKMES